MPVTQDQLLATIADLETLSIAGDALRDISAAAKTTALLSASAQALEGLRSQGELPLVAWGIGVRQVVCDIAAFKLLSTRGYSPVGGESGDSNIRTAYDDAVKRIALWASDKGAFPDVVFSNSGGTEGRPTAGPRVTTAFSRGFTTRGLDPRYGSVSSSNRPPFTGS